MQPDDQKPRVEAVRRVIKAANFYHVLGIEQNASSSEIKKAYHKLALLVHPDKCHIETAQKAFSRVGVAFETLNDSTKRKDYDEALKKLSKSSEKADENFEFRDRFHVNAESSEEEEEGEDESEEEDEDSGLRNRKKKTQKKKGKAPKGDKNARAKQNQFEDESEQQQQQQQEKPKFESDFERRQNKFAKMSLAKQLKLAYKDLMKTPLAQYSIYGAQELPACCVSATRQTLAILYSLLTFFAPGCSLTSLIGAPVMLASPLSFFFTSTPLISMIIGFWFFFVPLLCLRKDHATKFLVHLAMPFVRQRLRMHSTIIILIASTLLFTYTCWNPVAGFAWGLIFSLAAERRAFWGARLLPHVEANWTLWRAILAVSTFSFGLLCTKWTESAWMAIFGLISSLFVVIVDIELHKRIRTRIFTSGNDR